MRHSKRNLRESVNIQVRGHITVQERGDTELLQYKNWHGILRIVRIVIAVVSVAFYRSCSKVHEDLARYRHDWPLTWNLGYKYAVCTPNTPCLPFSVRYERTFTLPRLRIIGTKYKFGAFMQPL